VRFLCEKIVDITTLPVNERIRTELVRMAQSATGDAHQVAISDPPTHSEMACLLGTHREAVTKELKRLEKDGLIIWRPGQHVILDLESIRARCGESGP
jgi:CRP/FNR family cyclic AMP-dependent transcriptional regulator